MNLIVNMEMPKDLAIIVTILPDGRIIKHLGYKDKKQIGKIVGVLPETHGDLIDRHKTAEELNEMADAVYNDFPLVDRETLASWDHGIRMAAQYVLNLAGRKDAEERKDDEH